MDLKITKKEDGTFILDTGALEKAIKDGTVEAIKSEVKTAIETEKKNIFSGGDGDHLDREGKSVIDTSFFKKSFMQG